MDKKSSVILIILIALFFIFNNPEVSSQTSLLPDLEAERQKYCTPMSKAEIGQLLNAVAWKNRGAGWGLNQKPSGNNCPSPGGILIACDILQYEPTKIMYDVLVDTEEHAAPIWRIANPPNPPGPERPWVAPVQPPDIIPRDCSGGGNGGGGGSGSSQQPPRFPPPKPGAEVPQILGAQPNNPKPGGRVTIFGQNLTDRIQLYLSTGGPPIELTASLNSQRTNAAITLPDNISPGSYFVAALFNGSGVVFPNLFTVSQNQNVPPSEIPPAKDFGDLIENIFAWALRLVGAAVFVNFLWAGFLWFTAAGRTGPINQAKEKMFNALIGAIILLAAYLILNTINPDLVKQTFTLPGL